MQIQEALQPDGLFLAAMFGGETLFELRYAYAVFPFMGAKSFLELRFSLQKLSARVEYPLMFRPWLVGFFYLKRTE